MASQATDPSLFSMLPKGRTPWSEFVLSYGIQAIIVAIFVWVRVLNPEILESPRRDYHAIELVPTPEPVNHTPQKQLPKRVLVAKLDPVDPPVAALHLPAPQPRPKVRVEDTPAPEVKIAEKKLNLPNAATVVPRTIKTDVFSTGSSAPQTINRPASQVQTGGFGDPNGVPSKLNTGKAPVNIAAAGSFDMPRGPGYGNGTGGANGARGVVASTGFGNGVAVQDSRPTQRAAVKQAGFGDADVPAPPTVQSRPAPQASARVVPAEILSKPVPVYTPEARAQRIEGEVLLEVVLEASGRVRVLRVVRGLGHGLDDSAVRAAEQIHFKPAMQDGHPSDSTAVLHIIFQLA